MDRRKKPRQMHLFPVGDIEDDGVNENEHCNVTVEEVVDGLAQLIGEGRFRDYLLKKFSAENE